MGLLAMNLLPDTVDSLEHPDVQIFIGLLKNMADAYKCKLTSFAVHRGVVVFSFDSEEIMADLMADMEEMTGVRPQVCEDADKFVQKAKKIIPPST